jgi:hypothetical protein
MPLNPATMREQGVILTEHKPRTCPKLKAYARQVFLPETGNKQK